MARYRSWACRRVPAVLLTTLAFLLAVAAPGASQVSDSSLNHAEAHPTWAVRLRLPVDLWDDPEDAVEHATVHEEVSAKLRRATRAQRAAAAEDSSTSSLRKARQLERRSARRAVSAVQAADVATAVTISELQYAGRVADFDDIHLLQANEPLTAEQQTVITATLQNHPDVRWVQLQLGQERVRRSLDISDPLYGSQWHLKNNKYSGHDLHIEQVWGAGVTGEGVTVAIVDDGIDYTHADLEHRYNAEASWNFQDNNSNGKNGQFDNHGMRCASQVAAQKNNGVCGVGVAYDARVSSIRLLGGKTITDFMEASALTFKYDVNLIYSNSWGPSDDGQSVGGPDDLTQLALLDGVLNGRNGKGSVYVVASGNGHLNSDDCNYDGYVNSVYTIGIGAIGENNIVADYSEGCAALMGVTYSGGSSTGSPQRNIATADVNQLCTKAHSGTSAAAPLVSGIIALLLSQHPELSWRDVQHILVTAAAVVDSKHPSWIQNGIGLSFSPRYGFGLLRAQDVLLVAQEYTPLAANQSRAYTHHISDDFGQGTTVPANSQSSFEVFVPEAGAGFYSPLVLEHVALTVSLSLTGAKRNQVRIQLESPSGTSVVVGAPRPKDVATSGYEEIVFTSVATWAENPAGEWRVTITNTGTGTVTVSKLQLTVYGDGYEWDSVPPGINIVAAVLSSIAIVVCGGITAVFVRCRRGRGKEHEKRPAGAIALNDEELDAFDSFADPAGGGYQTNAHTLEDASLTSEQRENGPSHVGELVTKPAPEE